MAGFTLLELMIVVAIVAILASIAMSAYSNQIVKSRRTDAQRELVQWAQSQERYFTVNATYQNVAGTACGVAAPTGRQSNNFYTFSSAGNAEGTFCGADTFTLTAAPTVGTAQAGDGDQTISNTGAVTGTWRSN